MRVPWMSGEPRWLLPVLVVASFGMVGSVLPADAADPATGAVSDLAPTTSWTGGPFAVPNVTGTAAAEPVCDVPDSCDDFTLTVSTPAGYGADHVLSISVKWPSTAADFDVYVKDANGRTVGTAASQADPELVVLPPDSGTYTVRVVPFAPLGQSYTATAALVTKPANPAPSTEPAPTLTTYGAPESLPNAHGAGEPSIGNSFKTGATFFQSYLSTYKVGFDDTVNPAKAAWSDVSASATKGCPVGSTTSLDPILFTDHQTGRTLESQLSGVNSLTCYTDDDGQTWLPSTGGGIPSGVDHQTLGGGPYSANGVPRLPGGYPNAVYYCSQDIATAFCAASRDGGQTFANGVPTYSLLNCGGLHGHIKVAPDGTAYLPNKGCGAAQAAVVSDDNGLTWAVRPVPSSTPGGSDPSVGVGSNGTTYFGYTGADGMPRVAVSRDKGTTWTDNQAVGTEFGIKNSVFPAVVAGDDDRAAFAFIGTPTGGNYQDAANFKGVWHLYVSYTYDGGKSWVTADATPNDPVQLGSICTSGTTCGSDRNLLDFIDVTMDDHGRVLAAFADGCTGSCVTGGPNNRDAYATIARQSGGKTLRAAFDPLPNLTVSGVTAKVAENGASSVSATVANTGPAVAKGAVVRVLDNGTVIGTTAPANLVPGQRATVTVPWDTRKLKGTRTVVAVADPFNVIAESNEADNRATTTVALR
ncbi:MAG TPA: CARDB domain-containing protein [Kribbella sp.]